MSALTIPNEVWIGNLPFHADPRALQSLRTQGDLNVWELYVDGLIELPPNIETMKDEMFWKAAFISGQIIEG